MKPFLLLVLSLSVLLAACSEKPAEAPPAAPAVPAVDVVPFAELGFHPEREAPATLQGKNETRIAAEASARIVAVSVDSGDAVKAGQVLVRLDAKDAELALARAEAGLAQSAARLAQAEAQMDRARSLREKNFISAEALTLRETELAATRADVQSARASRDSARRGVDKCTVTAPFSGIVRTRTAQVGELAAPGTPLLTLADTSDLQVVAQVQARDAKGLAAAGKAEFAAAGRTHALSLLRISGAIDREARTVEARYRIDGAAPAPGTEGRLIWRDPRPYIPADYILRRSGRYGVFVLDGDKVSFRELPQAQEGRPASADFAPDVLIVTRGRHALQHGMAARIEGAAATK